MTPRYWQGAAPQLRLGRSELTRLANRIQEDFRNALSDHEARMRRFTTYYRRWRGRTELPFLGEEETSNFQVPLTQWQTYAKLSKEMASLFGEDSEIVARPVGPSDQRLVRKIARYMNWRVFDAMRIVNPATVFSFRKILFGRAHAYRPWIRDTYMVPLAEGGFVEEVDYEGPGFDPLWPDDLIVPAEDVKTIHDFSFVLRKYRATPDELLRGDGTLYQGVRKQFQDLVDFAGHRRQRDFESEPLKREKDMAEGVIYEGNLSAANCLIVHEWYGKWRMLRGKQDGRMDNLDRRQEYESELVVRYLPELHRIVGVQRLDQMYPKMKRRRPFVEASLVQDGSYWSPGFGELLEAIEQELTVNHNLATEAGEMSVGPVIFYRPASGFDPDTFTYEPKRAVATDDPAGVKVATFQADMEYPVTKEQTMRGYAERVTGVGDMNMGRALDQPNAPRTARQTLALLEEGDVRASLDTRALREDWSLILSDIWQLDSEFSPENVFFRVTEEEADGLFDVQKGGAYMTSQERGGKYDFDLKFATNAWSKETRKQNMLALYQLDLQNPLVAQNPKALWGVLDRIHRAFDDDRFCDLVPEPPDMGMPLKPDDEDSQILKGQTVNVNPLDNDQLHLLEHNKRLRDLRQDPEDQRDEQAYNLLVRHCLDHIDQLKQKQLMQALASKLVQQLQQNTATGQGLMQSPQAMGLEGLYQQLGQMIQPPNAPGQPGPNQTQPQPSGGGPLGGLGAQ